MMSEYISKEVLQIYINETYKDLINAREEKRSFKYGEYNYAFNAAIIDTLQKEINELCIIFELENPLDNEEIYVTY